MTNLFFRCIPLYLLFLCFCTSDLPSNKANEKGETRDLQNNSNQQPSLNNEKENTPFFLDIYRSMDKRAYYSLLDSYSTGGNPNIEKFMEFSDKGPREVYCYKIVLENNESYIADIIPTLGDDKVEAVELSLHNTHQIETNNSLLQTYLKKYGSPTFNNRCKSEIVPGIEAYEYGWITKDKAIVFTYASYLNERDQKMKTVRVQYSAPDSKIQRGDSELFCGYHCTYKEEKYLKDKGIPTKRNVEKAKDDL